MIIRSLNLLRNRLAVFCHDMVMVGISIYLAYIIRFNAVLISQEFFTGFYWLLGVALPVHAILYWYIGLYRGIWRFASIPDLIRVVRAVIFGVLITSLSIFLLQRAEGIPRMIFVLYPLLLVLSLAFPRILYRWVMDHHIKAGKRDKQRALIVATGRAGENLVRTLLLSGMYLPVALVDKTKSMLGMEIHGIRVVGGISDIRSIVKKYGIEIVLISKQGLSSKDLSNIVKIIRKYNIPCHVVSKSGSPDGVLPNIAQLRPISLEDLLYRDPVSMDSEGISKYLNNKKILITGGGGSIGSELCRQVAKRNPSSLIIFDNCEYNLFKIENDIKNLFPHLECKTILGDVKDAIRVEWLFLNTKPQVIFHAAAYKHVPLLEGNPIQAIQNNVIGTKILADTAEKYGCERFVLISTDKAVNPVNVMGVSKRIAEIYCQNLSTHSKIPFITTRFGNVLGSTGSVVPLFKEQIANGGPVTVTHPEISRYFMTTSEAVNLILQAGSMGQGGEIFVLDMGEPIKIKDFAEEMIRLAGFEPYQDIQIVFIGLRKGEKLYEELFHESEGLIGTSHPKLLLASYRKLDWNWLLKEMAVLEKAVREGNLSAIMQQVKVLVPEFKPITILEDSHDELKIARLKMAGK